MKRIIIGVVCSVLSLALVVGAGIVAYYSIGVKPGKLTNVTVGNGKTIKIGIISDTQLPRNNKKTTYREHLLKALTQLKEQNVEMIIHAGDVGDSSSSYAYKTYNEVFNSVYTDKNNVPEKLYILGNHDMWGISNRNSPGPKHRKFKRILGETPNSHKVVNGFHFIGASPDQGSTSEGYSEKATAWLEEQIEIAVKDTPDMPVFVVTHQNPADTVYGSDDWSDPALDPVLRKHSNVVSISGHSHYSLLDERSIYQNAYTALQTQSLAYIENETGKFDPFKGKIASVPPKDEDYPFMMIMEVGEDNTKIHRWNITDNKEEKADRLWTIDYPLTKENFKYTTELRKSANQAPSMANSKEVTLNSVIKSTLYEPIKGETTLRGITFTAGTDDDFVHSYKIVLTGEKEAEYTYFSDFYNGINNMTKTVNFALDKTLPSGSYNVKVYAIDSYDVVSEDYAEGNLRF